jgi:transposase
VNAIFYVLRGGITWRLLPKDFLPWQTVYRWFARLWMSRNPWFAQIVLPRLKEEVRAKLRD